MSISLRHSLIDKFIRDKDGQVVVFEKPNLPIIVWVVFTVIAKISSGTIERTAEHMAFGAILIWSCMEIFAGRSYFRRLLGLTILLVAINQRI